MSDSILAAIDAELDMLKNVRALLVTSDGTKPKAPAKKATMKRRLSAAARARIAAAQKKRWAKQKAGK